MRHLDQRKVVDKLTRAGRRMMRDRVETPAAKFLRMGWANMRKDVQAFVAGVWAQEHANESPYGARRARQRIAEYLERRVRQFREQSKGVLTTAMRQAYRLQYLVSAWIVDNTTPAQVRVKVAPGHYRTTGRVHRHLGARESTRYPANVPGNIRHLVEAWFDEPTDEPDDKDVKGKSVSSSTGKLDTYLKAWGGSAIVQAGMSIAGRLEPEDAADKIAGVKAGTYSPEAAFERIIRTQVQIAVMDAEDEFDQDNPGLTEDRIWRTMDDERVCTRCASQEGLHEDEWNFDMPLHDVCRCFVERIVKPFQDMLPADMRVPDVGGSSMVFMDPATGEPAGIAVVQFDEWTGKSGVKV